MLLFDRWDVERQKKGKGKKEKVTTVIIQVKYV